MMTDDESDCADDCPQPLAYDLFLNDLGDFFHHVQYEKEI
jgi:hypothetical protein